MFLPHRHLMLSKFTLLLISLCILRIQGFTQEYPDFFTVADIKKLEKSESNREKAAALTQEANEYYVEVYSMQSSDNDKKTEKKAEKLERKALSKHLQAASYFADANEVKYNVYLTALQNKIQEITGDELNQTKAKLLLEQAEEYYKRAKDMRRDAARLKEDKQKYQKLAEALEYETLAFEKQDEIMVILSVHTPTQGGVQYLSPVASSANAPTVLNEDQQKEVEINEKQLQAILASLNSKSENELDADFRKINYSSASSIKDSWYNYLYGSYETENLVTEKQPVAEDQLPNALAQETVEEKDVKDINEQTSPEVKTPPTPVEAPASSELPIAIAEKEQEAPAKPATIPETYRIQIAADREPLTQRTLQQLYKGDKKISIINEDGYNKYSIGDFDTFEEAEAYKTKMGIPNSFVAANIPDQEQTPVDIKPLAEEKPTPKAPVEKNQVKEVSNKGVDDNQIIFKVQIAASKVPVSKQQLRSIYKGEHTITMFEEDGWYKYAIDVTNDYTEAVKVRDETNIKGIFIAAYLHGEKLKLYEARKQTGKFNDNGIQFYVQIAASKSKMKDSQLRRVYKGDLDIVEFYEDGWYKYRVPAGSTYAEASKLRKSLGIKGAFISAYKDNKKIPVQEAIQESYK